MLNWVYSSAKWYSKEKHIKHRQLQMVQREAGRRESTSQRAWGGGGGGGGGLDLIVNYLDKIRSFWFVFVRLIQANRMFSMLKIGEMLFCCNTDVIQKFVSFNFYDLLLNVNWEKNLLTVFLHALVWLIIVYCMKGCATCYIQKLSYGFMSPIRYYNNQHVIIMC